MQRLQENISLAERGRLDVPPDSDVATFFVSDGKLTDRPKLEPPPKPLTLGELRDAYLQVHAHGALEANSLQTARMHVGHFIKTLGADFAVQGLTLDDLQRHVERRAKKKYRGRPLSPVTLRKEVASFRACWNWGVQASKVKGSFPNRGLKYPKTEEKPPFQTWQEIERQIARGGLSEAEQRALWDCLFLTLPQVADLLSHVKENARQPCVYPMFAFAAHTGARRSEVLRARIADVDLDGQTVLVPPQEIAILAPRWDDLGPARLLLEQAGVATQALDRGPIRLVRNYTSWLLLETLRKDPGKILGPTEKVEDRVVKFFNTHKRSLREPTVRALVRIAHHLDRERGLVVGEGMLPITAEEVCEEIHEFDAANETHRDDEAVLVTSCHGAKGLEFRKIVLLSDGFEPSRQDAERAGSDEAAWAEKRRLFYVAMTRAKEELVLCATQAGRLLTETGVAVSPAVPAEVTLPQRLTYLDLTPGDVDLGYRETTQRQRVIKELHEGTPLKFRVNRFGDGWLVCSDRGVVIGDLSRTADQNLHKRGLGAGKFEFAAGEVRVGRVYRHLKFDDITGDKTEDWFVIIPQLRVCR